MLLASTRDDCVWSTGGSGGREEGREGGREEVGGGREGGRERVMEGWRDGGREGGKERIVIIIILYILPIAERKGRREGKARDNEKQRQNTHIVRGHDSLKSECLHQKPP